MQPQGERVTEEMGIEPLGLHEGCGGEVWLILTSQGGTRACMVCGDQGPECLGIDPIEGIEITEVEV